MNLIIKLSIIEISKPKIPNMKKVYIYSQAFLLIELRPNNEIENNTIPTNKNE